MELLDLCMSIYLILSVSTVLPDDPDITRLPPLFECLETPLMRFKLVGE